MLKNENIICISSIDWDFIWQGHQEIMSRMAREGSTVLFIENTGVRAPGIRDFSRIKQRVKNWFKGIKGIRKESNNLYIYSPLILPFPYSFIARWINRYLILSVLDRWIRVMDFSDPVVWTFLPTPLSLDIAYNIIKKLLVYYCIDNFSASSSFAKKIKRSEERLLERSDIVFVTSKALESRCLKHNKNVHRFPFGVCLKEFENARLSEKIPPQELRNIKRPIIGYVGGIHKWVDKELIKTTAEKNPDYSFVFVGPLQADVGNLRKVRNIYFLGQKEHKDIPYFVKNFDVGIIPYLITEYTRNVYPTKLNEYLSLGKPVVSTDLPEVRSFNEDHGDIVYIADRSDKFGDCIKDALANKSAQLENKRIHSAAENSWESKIEKMSSVIMQEIVRKRIGIEERWKENLAGFYKTTRRRIIKAALFFLAGYFLLFSTPLLWFLAKPLRIQDKPQRADAIVVLGGGVGETGSPGKSTIERARYAVELYKKGFASSIIFSSGYTYVHNDADNMKMFAVSMGVDGFDVILEKRAGSTYENVIFSKSILDKKGFDSILLVSSPYNMRRASLVFDKYGKDVKVLYMPVPKSQFYDRSKGVRFKHIKAIAHEYLGIVYYFFKNYI